MNKLLFVAPSSGSGKTTVTMAVLAALKRQGRDLRAFKCGPDYIDPMFHEKALGIPCHNLDLYLTPEDRVKELFRRYSAGADTLVVEGVMGYYDGVGGVTAEASAWHVAEVLDLPAVLVLRPKGDLSAVLSQVQKLLTVPERAPKNDGNHHLKAILLSDCSEHDYRALKPTLEQSTGLSVLGYLPHMEEVALESRHLGLVTAGEDPELSRKLKLLAEAAECHIDLDALLMLGESPDRETKVPVEPGADFHPVPIAVAKDAAFQFCYDETLDAFREAGGEPVFFSPLNDEHLPENIGGLYLPGGYPELYAKELSENTSLCAELKRAIEGGLPTIAECGGFLYLGTSLQTPEGETFPMVGLLPGNAEKTEKPVRFGYAELTAPRDCLIAKKGDSIRIHNFHYYDTPERGSAFHAVKPVSGREFETGYVNDTLYAGFPHIYFAGNQELTARFVASARRFTVLETIRRVTPPEKALAKEARAKWNTCAKPLGSLGLLEDQVVSLCAVKGTLNPSMKTRTAVIFCADNGVVEEGVTQTGSEVTRLVFEQLKLGRSSVNRMAEVAGAKVLPVDMGMAPKGTRNIVKGPAMTEEELFRALHEGIALAKKLKEEGNGILIAGEMGIGNTTTASAVASVLLEKDPAEVTGKGAGLSNEGLEHKVEIIRKAIAVNRPNSAEPMEVLRTLGGLDLAGMCGLYLGGALYEIPVIMDGFPSAVAALCAVRVCPAASAAILPSHVSAEPAGQMVLEAMGKRAPIAAGMRLGEGTGGVALLPLLDMALAVFEEAYTFEEGGIEPYQTL